jgi:hypothetical protein
MFYGQLFDSFFLFPRLGVAIKLVEIVGERKQTHKLGRWATMMVGNSNLHFITYKFDSMMVILN